MLLTDKEIEERLNSPLNLINRLKSVKEKSSLDLFIPKVDNTKRDDVIIPELTDDTPTVDKLIEGAEDKIKLNLAHDNSLKLLNTAIDHLALKIDDIKAEKLPSVIMSVSKVVEGIRRERNEANKSNQGREVHLHFYSPTQKSSSDYEIVEVG